MSICMKNFNFSIKLLKNLFVANVKWREEPGFGMLHHIYGMEPTQQFSFNGLELALC